MKEFKQDKEALELEIFKLLLAFQDKHEIKINSLGLVRMTRSNVFLDEDDAIVRVDIGINL